MNPKHEFALYTPHLGSLLTAAQAERILLNDERLYHRISHILRLQPGERLVVFDAYNNVQCEITRFVSKKVVEVTILSKHHNRVLSPFITVLLPLLKKEALHEALYSCVELGANGIQLISTQKTQRSLHGEKEAQRLHATMIAAAEQSKNFALPVLHQPLALKDALAALPEHTKLIHCDVNGQPLVTVLEQLRKTDASYALVIGPEGDLTDDEREFTKKHGAIICALTPTVLRAQQALVVALGAMRSIAQ